MLIDTHVHLYADAFDPDRDEVIARALAGGVERFYLPAIDASFTPGMRRLKEAYPERVYLMAGLHPTHVGDGYLEELEHVARELQTGDYVAVGEIGIDLYWDTSRLQEQQDAFRRQISLAREFALPIVIHCRDAFDEIFDVLESERHPGLRGIFHCFTGTEDQARRALGLGFKLGIGGVATFKNGGLDRFLSGIPLEELVLETDAPYLAPVPHRGKRNEPAYLGLVLSRVAGLYGLSEPEVAAITGKTARSVFATP